MIVVGISGTVFIAVVVLTVLAMFHDGTKVIGARRRRDARVAEMYPGISPESQASRMRTDGIPGKAEN
jgi:hypothetical protein